MKLNRLIPELDVSDFDTSLKFYLEVIGCQILYDRPEDRFAMLSLEGSHIMLEEAQGEGRRFTIAALEYPFGRGINFQVQVADVDLVYKRCLDCHCNIIVPIEDRWYRAGTCELGNRQFVVADPDGYLLRPFTDLGEKRIGRKT